MKHQLVLKIACASLFSAWIASAAPTIFISVDEKGVGTVMSNGQTVALRSLGNILDPFDPTGPRPLTYDLGGNRLIGQVPVVGDYVLTEGMGGPPADLLRFNAAGQLLFYSDSEAGEAPDQADVGITTTRQTNIFTFAEVPFGGQGNLEGSATGNGLVILPNQGNPGFPGAAGQLEYDFISDNPIPEPGTVLLLVVGVGIVLGYGRRARIIDKQLLS
jgi:hypothetical protein